MSQSLPNRIPAEKLDYCRDWTLPEFEESGRVIPSAEKEARDKRGGREYVEDVEQETDELQPLTAEMLAEITKAAEQDGYQAGFSKGEKHGYEAGFSAGLKAAEEKINTEMDRLRQISETLTEPLQQQEQALEGIILEMITALSRSVIKRDLQLDSSHILELTKEAIASLPTSREQVKLYLNPEDLAVLETYAQEHEKNWRFISQADLLPGGVRVETQESLVDFSVETRMQTVFEQFSQRQFALTNDEMNDGEDDDPSPADGVSG